MTATPPPPDLERLLGERAWLTSLARQLVRRDEVADEAAHEAIAAAWAASGPAQTSVRGWLAAILRKQLAGRRRAVLRQRARDATSAPLDPAPPAVDVVARFEVQRAVADAVLALPEPYRTTVLRRFWEDETPAAIAAAMQVPVETVRTRCKRGLAMLRERLDGAHGGERRAWALPLWIVGRRAGSFAGIALLGVSLMTVMQKLLAAGIAAGLAVLLWAALPGLRPDAPAPVPVDGGVAPAVAAGAPPASTPADGAPAPVLPTRELAPVPRGGPDLVVVGRVVDDATDAPLAGIPVRLVGWPRDEGTEVEAASGADGRFTLQAGPAASSGRDVLVVSPMHAFARRRVTMAETADGAAPLRGEVGTLRLVQGTWLSGTVVDAEGVGVADAHLLLPLEQIGVGGFGPQQMLQRFAALGRSDATGRFRLPCAIGPDFEHASLLFAVSASGIGWHRFTPTKQRTAVDDVVIRQRPSGALRVVVRDPAGTPGAGVLVRALPRFGPIGWEGPSVRMEPSGLEPVRSMFRATTRADGTATFAALPLREFDLVRADGVRDGAYELWIEPPGYGHQPLVPCEVRAGGEVTIEVRLVAARGITVAVAVRDDLGAPVPQAAVEVRGERPEHRVTGTTDATGTVKVAIEAAPKLAVVVTRAAHRTGRRSLVLDADAAEVTANVVLTRTVPLEGVVVDQFGEPVRAVAISSDGSAIDATTDAQGRFRAAGFPVGVQPLTLALAPGTDPAQWTGRHEPEVVDAARGPVRIVMHRRPGSTDVRIAIVDAQTGAALEPTAARLGLFDAERRFFGLAKGVRTGAGFVHASATPAGRWRLDVVTASGHRGSLPFELDGTLTTAELRLSLPQPGAITGRVQFAGVAVPATLHVHVRHRERDPFAFEQYRFPGRWVVDAATQEVLGAANGGSGYLAMQPLRNASFRLDRVDPAGDLAFEVVGDGVVGDAAVRVTPGGTADVVIELRAKPR